MPRKKDVFVIMPFSATATCTEAQWTEIFENVFQPAITACGYSCERAVPSTGSLIASIIDRLKTARVVLADITDRNPNVFYELGVRHSLSKRTIIVSQDTASIPSDLRGYWSIKYGLRPAQVTKFKKDIRKLIRQIEADPHKSDSPVSDYLERENASVSAYAQIENIKKLEALYTELSRNILCLENAPDGALAEGQAVDVSTDCLKLLLHTRYVSVGPDLLRQGYELLRTLEHIRGGHILTIPATTVTEAKALSNGIVAMRELLGQVDYEEPEQISTLVWEPLDTGAFRVSFCSRRGSHEFAVAARDAAVQAILSQNGPLADPPATKPPREQPPKAPVGTKESAKKKLEKKGPQSARRRKKRP